MKIELRCPACACHFSAGPHTTRDEVLERMTEEGPWFALADGETFEDMVFAALVVRGRIRCPECRAGVTVTGTSVGWLAWCEGSPGPHPAARPGRVPQPA